MNSTIRNPKLLAGALCGLLLVGCDSIKSVPEEPSAILPPQTVILGGTITGLGSLRSVTLTNNGVDASSKSFLAPAPNLPNVDPEVRFSMGSFPEGSNYNITVKDNPFGKSCTVTNPTGVISAASPPDIAVVCTNTMVRYDLTVHLPSTAALFTALPNAKVRLTTEEKIYEQGVTAGQTTVVFDDVLFNAAFAATGQLNRFNWTVTASIPETGNVVSKCFVTGPTGVDPTGNIASPLIGNGTVVGGAVTVQPTAAPCAFTVGGNIGYSQPSGVAYAPTLISGLELQLRDVQGNSKETLVVPNCTPATQALTCNYQFAFSSRSNATGVYDVAVSRHPTGQYCVVANAGSANLYVTGTANPASVSNANVRCRALPSAQKQLRGLYRLETTVYTPNNANPGATVTSTYATYDTTIHNTASSNMLALFTDGTFLYGTHATANQIEHGFYDFDPVNAKIRFHLITDTNNSTVFPATFSPNAATSAAGTLTATPGLSAVPSSATATPVSVDGFAARSLSGVTFGTDVSPFGTVRRISGVFGADTAAPFTAATSRVAWTLTEPNNVDTEMTGTWISQDHRRFFSWDYRTYYGIHVGVQGGAASMNDACFTLEDLHATEGIYTRRGTISLCLPFSRPASTTTNYGVGFAESIDFSAPTVAGLPLPGFIGRLPGGQSAADGRSPSPIRFKVAPAASFATDAAYFTAPATPFTTWCTTEILGIRATINDNPIDYPVYLCRERGAAPTP